MSYHQRTYSNQYDPTFPPDFPGGSYQGSGDGRSDVPNPFAAPQLLQTSFPQPPVMMSFDPNNVSNSHQQQNPFIRTCSSDRNQYLQTGELNEESNVLVDDLNNLNLDPNLSVGLGPNDNSYGGNSYAQVLSSDPLNILTGDIEGDEGNFGGVLPSREEYGAISGIEAEGPSNFPAMLPTFQRIVPGENNSDFPPSSSNVSIMNNSPVVATTPGAVIPSNSNTASLPIGQVLQPNHQRSDNVTDDPPSKNSQNQQGKHLETDTISETEESVVVDRERNRRSKNEGKRLKERYRRDRFSSFNDEDSVDEDDRRKFVGKSKDREERYSREWEREREEREKAGRDKYRERDRRDRDFERRGGDRGRERDDWDTRSNHSKYNTSRRHDGEYSMPRPRSRTSNYDRDEYYYGSHGRSLRYDELSMSRDDYRTRRYPPMDYPDPQHSYNHYPGQVRAPAFGGPAPSFSIGQQSGNGNQFLTFLYEFRKRDPILYREWFHQYQIYQKNPTLPFPVPPGYHQLSYGGNQSGPSSLPYMGSSKMGVERPDVTGSGRSSVDSNFHRHEELGMKRDDVTNEQPYDPNYGRNTPLKFPTAHSKHLFNGPQGRLLKLVGSHRMVEILDVKNLFYNFPEYKEVELFNGPLIKKTTHKNDVIRFCQRKMKEAMNRNIVDVDNFILIWEMLILLLKQNGSLVGSDVAELLLRSKSNPEESDNEETNAVHNFTSLNPIPHDDKLIDKYREFLLQGHKQNALEFAISNNMWGHAFYLASKMDDRTYGKIMSRFAAGISLNDPIQTLYQIMNGKQPSSVTSCGENSFGDWRPHLAMILSNSGSQPELESKTIITLGDTLASRNQWYAAQFCYLLGEMEFSSNTRLGQLLGLSPKGENVIEATQMSEIYEFALSMADRDSTLGTCFLQPKLEYTKTLVELGFCNQALFYCEEMAKKLQTVKVNSLALDSIRFAVLELGEKLQKTEISNNEEPFWIQGLRDSLGKELFEDSSRKTSVASLPAPISHDLPDYSSQSQIQTVDSIQQQQQQFNDNGLKSTAYTPDDSIQPGGFQNYPQMLSIQQPSTNYQSDWSSGQQNQYGDQALLSQPLSESQSNPNLQHQGFKKPSFDSSVINNNYIDGFHSGENKVGMPGINLSAGGDFQNAYLSKKKSVRFEDEDDPIADSTSIDSNVTFAQVGNKGKGKSALKGFSLGAQRSKSLDDFSQPHKHLIKSTSSFAIAEEEDWDESFGRDSEVGFKSSLERSLKRSPSFLAGPKKFPLLETPKTFPIDRECCTTENPCEDHETHTYAKGNAAWTDESESQIEKSNSAGSKVKGQAKSEPMKLGGGSSQHQQQIKGQSDLSDKSKKDKKSKGDGGQGWLSWIPSSLVPKPKNQMILPDDKDPAIVWDENTKTWINTQGGDAEDSGPKGPPPKDSEINQRFQPPPSQFPSHQSGQQIHNPQHQQHQQQHQQQQQQHQQQQQQQHQQQQQQIPHASLMANNPQQFQPQKADIAKKEIPNGPVQFANSGNNKYLRPKGLSLKNNYVDILSQGQGNSQPAAKAHIPPMVPNLFIPSPVSSGEDGPVSFLTQGLQPPEMHSEETVNQLQQSQAPQMFNPRNFN